MAIRGPIRYAEHLTRERYHPRSSKHGDYLSQTLVLDLLDASPVLRSAAARGKLVFTANHAIEVADKSVAETLPEDARKDLAWNMDLVIGPPGDEPPPVLRRKNRKGEEEAHLITPDIMKRGAPREVRVRGDSMNRTKVENQTIEDGDLVLVRQQERADPGKIVVALVDGEATIKKLVKGPGYYVLQPNSTNLKHRPIIVAQDFRIQGIVARVFKKGGDLLGTHGTGNHQLRST